MERKATRRRAAGLAAVVTTTVGSSAFVGPLHHVSKIASTVPGSGDVNPYGVAVIPSSIGDLSQGNILVSNFNDKANVQGTGTTIMEVTPSGKARVFAAINKNLPGCPGGVGLTTALTALESGWVIVGSLPTRGGSISGAGCLIVLDRWGHVRETFTGQGINGPWDMTADDLGDQAVLFVTNVLNGTVAAHGHTVYEGSVVRLDVAIPSSGLPYIWYADQIGSWLPERLNSAALVIGPTGLGLGADGTLYVADTLDSRITAIPDALDQADDPGPGYTVAAHGHLNGELGLVIAPNGDILTVNGGNGNLVEVTPSGTQIAVQRLDSSGSPAGAGALFGLAVAPNHNAVYYVDDATNTLNLLHA
jgi:sugar lactone lactonase YvrE